MNDKDDSVKIENEATQSVVTIETSNQTQSRELLTNDDNACTGSVPPKQTITRSFSRSTMDTPDFMEKSRQSVISNASVITRQASSSSILVRTSPDDAKRPESTRPESTMMTLKEHPEALDDEPQDKKGNDKKTAAPLKRTLSKSTIAPSLPPNKPMVRQLSKTAMAAPGTGQRKEFMGTIESVAEHPEHHEMKDASSQKPKQMSQLKRTMSKAAIAPAPDDKKQFNRQMSRSNMTPNITAKAPMNRQMSRTMSRAALKLGEHLPSPALPLKEETTNDESNETAQLQEDVGQSVGDKKENQSQEKGDKQIEEKSKQNDVQGETTEGTPNDNETDDDIVNAEMVAQDIKSASEQTAEKETDEISKLQEKQTDGAKTMNEVDAEIDTKAEE